MISVHDLVVELHTEHGVLRAIDALRITLARGETFALVGESGCGKSMTALALMRLLPDIARIPQGQVRLGAHDLLDLAEADMQHVRGGRVAMIFQEPGTSLNPVMRVGDQIIEAIETHTPLRGAQARAKALQWMQRVGIPEPERRIDDYPFRMSGGQKQRVMIAMALAAEPEYLVADEPTTALDVTIQAQILDLLKDLQRERQLGLMLITHDLGVVRQVAHRVALMYAGEIVEVASAQDFFARPRHPYARALLQALPGHGAPGAPLLAIPGTVPSLTQTFTACRFAPRCTQALPACLAAPVVMSEPAPGHSVRCLRGDEAFAPAAIATPKPGPPSAVPQADPMAQAEQARKDATPVLDIQDLWVRYPVRGGALQRVVGQFNAVRGVSLRLHAGRTLALVGESGCGKTTIGKAVVQLLRGQANISGKALLDGQDLFSMQGDALMAARRQVQIIFQDPFASLNPRLRVAQILEEGLTALRPEWDAAARRQRIHTLTEQVGLPANALQRYPHEFSGGQRQRIAIARALAVEPRIIVCDEPTSALDVSVQAQILNLLKELQSRLGVAYLFITHNMGVVRHLADDVAVMREGEVVESGRCQALFISQKNPYTQTLLRAGAP